MKPGAVLARRPWSMTARLITLQVLAVALLLGGAMISLYYMIAAHLEQDNRSELASEARILAHWVAATGLDQGRDAASQIERAQTMATLPVFVRIVGPDGTIRLEHGEPLHVPREVFPPPGAEAEAWRAPTHERFLLSSLLLPAPPRQKGAVLEVAYDVSDDDTLLRHLRQRMGLVFALTVAISALLASLIARGVFRPLAQLTAATARVQASQLDARIDEAGWPAELIPSRTSSTPCCTGSRIPSAGSRASRRTCPMSCAPPSTTSAARPRSPSTRSGIPRNTGACSNPAWRNVPASAA